MLCGMLTIAEDSHVGTPVCRNWSSATRVTHSVHDFHSAGGLLWVREDRKCDALTLRHNDIYWSQAVLLQHITYLWLDDSSLQVAQEHLQHIQPRPGHGSGIYRLKLVVLEPLEMQMYVCGTHTHTHT